MPYPEVEFFLASKKDKSPATKTTGATKKNNGAAKSDTDTTTDSAPGPKLEITTSRQFNSWIAE